MQPASFWAKALLHGFEANCVWHAVIPTIMTSKAPKWERVETAIDTSNPMVVAAHRANLCCAKCGVSLEGNLYRVAVRFLITKSNAKMYPPDGCDYVLTRTFFNTAGFCFGCIDQGKPVPHLDANSEMQNFILDQLESIGLDLFCEPTLVGEYVEEDGKKIWQKLLDVLHLRHKEVLHALGKMDCKCPACGRPSPKKRCSGCHYARYCNTDCSRRDWNKHKLECEFLCRFSLFMPLTFAHEEIL